MGRSRLRGIRSRGRRLPGGMGETRCHDGPRELTGYESGASVDDLQYLARKARPRGRGSHVAHERRALHMADDHEALGLRVNGFLPADVGVGILAEIERRAATCGPDPASGSYDPWPARCADALCELLMDPAGSDPEVGRTPPSRATATVVAHIRVEDLQVQVASTTGGHLDAGPTTSAETAPASVVTATPRSPPTSTTAPRSRSPTRTRRSPSASVASCDIATEVVASPVADGRDSRRSTTSATEPTAGTPARRT